MNYNASEEKKVLLDKYTGRGEMFSFADALTTNMGEIFQACAKVRIPDSDIENILSSVLDNTFQNLVNEHEERLRMAGFEAEASLISTNVENIYRLSQGEEQSSVAKDEAGKVVSAHLKNVIQRIQQEKREFVNLLRNKFAEDAQKSLKGELRDNKDAQSYILLRKLTKPD